MNNKPHEPNFADRMSAAQEAMAQAAKYDEQINDIQKGFMNGREGLGGKVIDRDYAEMQASLARRAAERALESSRRERVVQKIGRWFTRSR